MQPTHNYQYGARFFDHRPAGAIVVLIAALVAGSISTLRGDQIEMQNGDRYNGKVISLTNDVMVLQSEVLGKIVIPRSRIANISLAGAGTNAAGVTREAKTDPKAVATATNSPASTLASLRASAGSGDEAEKVKQQFLADADPAAKAKFDEMLGDLMTGKMNLADLRVQAKSAADQLRGMKKELGPEADPTLDGYLAVLESFLRETPASGTSTRTNLQRSYTQPKAQ